MKSPIRPTVLIMMTVCFFSIIHSAGAAIYGDQKALQGVTTSRTLFDINLTEAPKLELYLGVIKQTQADLVRQGVTPEIVIAFRGASVRLITSETWTFSVEEQESLERSAGLLAELAESGIRVEACAIATNLFKVDTNTLLPGIEVVGNTFVSLTGYQTKGYALIPIQ